MDDERELAAAAEELADVLERLRGELRPSRGPLGLPRPPTSRELLRVTEGYAIPTLIAVLEANIRMLELLAVTIRVADGRPIDDGNRERIGDAGRAALGKMDAVLEDVTSAVDGGEPSNPEVKRLLAEARELREEIDDRLAAAEEGREATGETARSDETEPIGIDVDEELASIKRDVDGPNGDDQTGSN